MSSWNRPRHRGALHAGTRDEPTTWRPIRLHDEEPDEALDPVAVDELNAAPAESEVAPGLDPDEVQVQIDNAYTRGYEDGRAEGAAAEASRLSTALAALERAAAGFEDHQPKWLDALERNLVALSTAIARELIGRELRGSAEDVASLVHQAVSEFPLEAAVRVRINPADLSSISSPLQSDALRAGRELRWVPDPSIAPGGCLVEGPESLVDGRIEKGLERIYSKLVYE